MGGDPDRINPVVPCDLVIDHSVQVDHYGTPEAFRLNVALEFDRNTERYQLLKFAQRAFQNFRVVPPGMGIVHQVNLEYLAPAMQLREQHGSLTAYPDTLVGTDSHTTMINGLGVVGWGVGGIEAEAVMLGQPYFMLIPDVVGMKLIGELPPGNDRHRPGAPGDADAPQARRGRQVRGVLRPRALRPRAGRPRHHREHGAGIRRHRRVLPDRRRNAPLPAANRPRSRDGGPGGALLPRSRVSFAPTPPRTRSSPHARTRSRDDRAEPGGPEAPAGPGAAPNLAPELCRQPARADAAGGPGGPAGFGLGGSGRWANEGGGTGARRVAVRPERATCRDQRRGARAAGRGRRDRRHHLVHQHLESLGDDRGRPPGQESRRARAPEPALGQDQPGARLTGRDGLPQGRRPRAVSRPARLPDRRLRLHHVHREQRAAAGAGGAGHRGALAWWRPCSRATGTSRPAFTPWCAPTTWPRRCSWWRSRCSAG